MDVEEIVEIDSGFRILYEGSEYPPFDLLLQIIENKNETIQSVKIATITDQYLHYINSLDVIDMEETTEFLNLATRLIEIKSKALLPIEKTDDEEEPIDDEALLKMQLEEYKLFKEAGGSLHDIENVNRFYKQPDKSVNDTRIVFNQFNLEKLLDAFAFLLMKTKDREALPEKKINRDRWTVAEKITFLNNVLKDNKEINFFSLFDDTYSKLEVITVFMAILELLKFQKIEVVQAERYSDITIKRKEVENNESK